MVDPTLESTLQNCIPTNITRSTSHHHYKVRVKDQEEKTTQTTHTVCAGSQVYNTIPYQLHRLVTLQDTQQLLTMHYLSLFPYKSLIKHPYARTSTQEIYKHSWCRFQFFFSKVFFDKNFLLIIITIMIIIIIMIIITYMVIIKIYHEKRQTLKMQLLSTLKIFLLREIFSCRTLSLLRLMAFFNTRYNTFVIRENYLLFYLNFHLLLVVIIITILDIKNADRKTLRYIYSFIYTIVIT